MNFYIPKPCWICDTRVFCTTKLFAVWGEERNLLEKLHEQISMDGLIGFWDNRTGILVINREKINNLKIP
jgi:hypothetical protein